VKYLTLVWAGLWRKPARTLLTLLSVTIAFFLFGLLQGVSSGFASVIAQQQLDRMFIDPALPGQLLPYTHREQIARVPGIKLLTEVSFLGSYYQEQGNFVQAVFTNVDTWLGIRPEWSYAEAELAAVLRTRVGVMISDGLATKNGWKVGDRFTIPLGVATKDGSSEWTFEVLGIMTNKDIPEARNFLANASYYDEARATGTGMVNRFLMRIEDPRRSTQTAREIDALFVNSPAPTRTQSEQAQVQSRIQNIGDVNFFTRAIMGAVFFALLLLTANTMMESVRERTSEFGVLKTLGFTGTRIFVLVVTESFLLFVVGAAIGLITAASQYPRLRPYIGLVDFPPSVIGWGLAFAVAAALVSAGIPAWRAKRLDVVAALAIR
jgi:putative ABC transport system permease protein